MDHQEFAQLLGNYGEFVGAIAVVATLFYLALQVRQGKEATEANTRSIDDFSPGHCGPTNGRDILFTSARASG